MKYLKKSAALLLALIMILALSAPALAAEGDPTYSITISNPAVGDTYSAYKIFDVTYAIICGNADTSHTHDDTCYNVSYTITKTVDTNGAATGVWAAVLNFMGGTDTNNDGTYDYSSPATANNGVYTGNGLTLTPSAGDPNVFVVSTATDPAFSAANFAAYLKTQATANSLGTADATKNLTEENKATTLENDGTLKLNVTKNNDNNGGPGYYLIVCTGTDVHDKTPALAELTTTKPSVTIQDKNDIPFEKEVSDTNGVEIGQTVTYTITGVVPSTSGYDTYTYKVSDKMSQGLTFDLSSVKIKVGTIDEYPVTAPATSDWTVTGIYGYWDDTTGAWVTTYTESDVTKTFDKAEKKTIDGTERDVILIGFTANVDFVQKDVDGNGIQGSNKYTVGDSIVITYSATVNDQAVSVVSQNEATLTYSNDPGTEETSTPVNADVYSSKIVITKFDGSYTQANITEFTTGTTYFTKNTDGTYTAVADDAMFSTAETYYTADSSASGDALANAEFVLYRWAKDVDGVRTYVNDLDADGKKNDGTAETGAYKVYYKYTAADATTPAKVTWYKLADNETIASVVATENQTSVTVAKTDTNGKAEFKGLEDGTYYLLETKAPDGYNLLKDPVSVTVDGSGDKNEDGTVKKDAEGNIIRTLTVNADVANNAGSLLPSTGGMGTTIFYIVGAILVLGAAVLLITRRRMNADK